MRCIIALLISCLLSTTAYCQTDTAAIKRAEALRLFPQYMAALADYEKQHGHYIQTPNVKMHYLTWGKPTGIPLLWSHGTFGNTYEMYDFGDSLAAVGYYVIAIDYYGHGLTPIPAKEVSLYHLADDIKYLLDKMKIKKAVIGGFSRGGSVSTAFYDAYPDYVLGLILEDGGSVAWSVNEHMVSTDSLARRITQSFANRQSPTIYDTDTALFVAMYSRIGDRPVFKKRVFESYNRLKKTDSTGKWRINPGIGDFVCDRTAEQCITNINRPFAANSLFGASTTLLYPKVIYRNLDIPMLILDPVSDNDWFDFEKENTLLQKSHPQYITHKVYRNTGHTVKEEHHHEFIQDLTAFLQQVKKK